MRKAEPTRPNTLEEWYLDALAFLYQRYRYENDVFLDDVAGRFAIRATCAWKRFDPSRGKAFTFLCWIARAAYSDAVTHRKRGRDLMGGLHRERMTEEWLHHCVGSEREDGER